MLTFSKKSLLACALLIMSHPLLANDKSLLVNGVYAAVHGDISTDKGDWRNGESFSAVRLKAGFQLVRIGFVAVTIGYQKVGMYTAEKNWTKSADNKVHFDYRGPVAELHLFPEAMFSFSVAMHKGDGFSFQTGDATAFGLNCAADIYCAATTVERSRLSVSELTAQVNYLFRPGLALFLGLGNRHVEGTPYYQLYRAKKDSSGNSVLDSEGKTINPTSFERLTGSSWTMDNKVMLVGIRGTTL